MYFNRTDDYIVKSKNENFEISSKKEIIIKEFLKVCFFEFIVFLILFVLKSESLRMIVFFECIFTIVFIINEINCIWKIKIANKEMCIVNGFKKYQIPLENIINCKMESINELSMPQDDSIINREMIRIEFLKEKRIKVIHLVWKHNIYRKITFKKWKGKEKINANEQEVIKLLGYFKTKNQPDSSPELDVPEKYSDIRHENKNREIEDLINKEEDKSRNEIRKSFKQFIIILFLIFAVAIMSPVVLPVIIKILNGGN